MAIINIDTDSLRSINSNISSADDILLNSYLPSLTSELQSVYSNVQNSEVRGLINTINEKITTISTSLKTELLNLEDFLDSQLASYEADIDDAEVALESVILKMGVIAGTSGTIAASNSTAPSSSDTTTTTTTETTTAEATATSTTTEDQNFFERANSIAAENASSYWENYVNSFSNYYSDTADSHGVISGAFNVVTDTVEAVVGTAWNTATFLLNEAAVGVQWVGDVLFGESGLGYLVDWLI